MRNCYPVIRRVTRPIRRHIRRHAAFHVASLATVVCVGGPLGLLWFVPPLVVPNAETIANIPEPTTWLLLGLGAVNLGILRAFRGRRMS